MKKILFTGQGGQGVLSMGLMLTESAMYAGKWWSGKLWRNN